MTERRRLRMAPSLPRVPVHVGVMFSAATAGYAITLAAVTGFQASVEAERIAYRAPVVRGVEDIASGHDSIASRLLAAGAAYEDAAKAYGDASAVLAEVDQRLADLAAAVAEIDGVARNLPTSVRVPLRASTVKVSAPTTHATTGGSGG